jgi:RimJ/RimL family protein N-acetyltransferase
VTIPSIVLRDVCEDDLPVLFEHQLDAEAARRADFPSRDWPAFHAHWSRILRDDSTMRKAIVFENAVVGNIVSWSQDGDRLVGYWLGREHWGKGLATAALSAFLGLETSRPLVAHVAVHNGASVRVLEKCGFRLIDRGRRDETTRDKELVLTLSSPTTPVRDGGAEFGRVVKSSCA